MHKVRANFHKFSIAAINIAPRRLKFRTKIFLPRQAVLAVTTRRRNPGHSDALANMKSRGSYACLGMLLVFQWYVARLHNLSYNLMPRHYWQLRWRSPSFDLIQLRVADSASCHAQQNFTWSRVRLRVLDQPKGRLRRLDFPQRFKDHGFHRLGTNGLIKIDWIIVSSYFGGRVRA